MSVNFVKRVFQKTLISCLLTVKSQEFYGIFAFLL